MRSIALCCGLLLLASCTEIADGATTASRAVRGGTYNATEKFQGWLQYRPTPNVPKEAQRGYCYRASSDILCYDEPQRTTSKLVGYQENGIFIPATSDGTSRAEVTPAVSTTQEVSLNEKSPFYRKHDTYVGTDGKTVNAEKFATSDTAPIESVSMKENAPAVTKANTTLPSKISSPRKLLAQ